MGSCCSCLNRDGLSDNHPTKFKVTNVDDEGLELGAGVMELTQSELVLHMPQRDDIRWPYLCLRRYGYDANLFSFESGRRCQTGQGIFAFKCSRAEEIFNLLQDLMQCNSINVMEEPVIITRNSHPPGFDLPRTPQQPSALGYSVSSFSNGFPGCPAARHPSLGEESTHALIAPDEQSHTYVNTPGGEEAPGRSRCLQPLPAARAPFLPPPPGPDRRDPQVFLQPGRVKFVLGPGLAAQHGKCQGLRPGPRDPAVHDNNNEGASECPARPPCAYENVGGAGAGGALALRRGPGAGLAGLAGLAPRRPLHYENLPPLWEGGARPAPGPGPDDADCGDGLTPSSNGGPDGDAGDEDQTPLQRPRAGAARSLGLPAPLAARRLRASPRIFNFDFRRPGPEPPRQLNYIQVELKGWGGAASATTDAAAPHPARSSDSYAVIDLKKTAAMSSLQRALPRDDGTARKTRHNSTDLPL
ncbi:fibroblast growth factor receptor substrate 3 [Perognathus longimembris pacificus]|uniref:fibroblast growth factor receptor substrate 3 n=1 Tax=Perognathus longimembris pacificus TaxID=214514 RepID=UPI0020184274|nr:fibroblast growth factor receptor substrate 3 [Perognathus longimembris pacificus]XP_048203741.1 fibroblast growth factor receptor substrate 3 [Perognathus longimembris pacificus]XP_048203742.1 fibroblast growth factor receptor substrate 3 [Perognathus longimembris pacificus]XP_048203743.1 fibroblast growth factor receptor substrate 3 [Perognathus longimembris pacificus]